MTEQDLATCHCIIGHPDKAKFLVVRHSEGWQPPTLRFPPGDADYRVVMINDGMLRKYGLKTRVLRSLHSNPYYHCLEMELPSGRGSKNLEAVWVDREQYLKFRTKTEDRADPIEGWLLERESGEIPAHKQPWESPGWFAEADHWIHFQLDRLDIQPVGEVQQFFLGHGRSCVLRVPTTEGTIYFKAGNDRPPCEGALTEALARAWPDKVILPLAADARRNWMLNRDFTRGGSRIGSVADLPEFAAVLAALQVESRNSLDQWKTLGCPDRGLAWLLEVLNSRKALHRQLQQGMGRTGEDRLEGLDAVLDHQADLVRQLSTFAIPDMLVHTDFRDVHLAIQGEERRIFDWENTVVGHPFFALHRVSAHHQAEPEALAAVEALPIDDVLLQQIIKAYLGPFLPFDKAVRLEKAMQLARQLFLFWDSCLVLEELEWTQADSPQYYRLQDQLRNIVSRMLRIRPR